MTPPGSRSSGRRLAQVAAVAGTESAKYAALRAANLTRSERRTQAALEARQAEFVERIVILLGSMRGVAVKLGQMLSLADGGIIPAASRQHFHERLAELQDGVPPVPWNRMREHIERELGASLGATFARFDDQPVAAASIGQVYRARTQDGRDVAVKVQYPDIEETVRSDLQILGLALRLVHQLYPGVDASATAAELKQRIEEELDYEREAESTRLMARAYEGHPFIHIPDVVDGIGTRRLIVMDWIDGEPLRLARDAPAARRARIAEILFRFYVGGAYDARICSLDPHPGNVLLLKDGRVAFLDFGSIHLLSQADVDSNLDVMQALFDQDAGRLALALEARGVISHDAIAVDALHAAFTGVFGWYTADETVEVTPALVDRMVAGGLDIRTTSAALLWSHEIPPDFAWIARADIALAASLGQLRPTLNFHRIAREWVTDSAPDTELGRQHRDWRVRRAEIHAV